MELNTAVDLIKNGIPSSTKPQTWADLGAGSGLFTAALSTLIMSGSTIYSIDKDATVLTHIKIPTREIILKRVVMDFINDPLVIEPLDGIIMANALHFVKNKLDFLENVKRALKSKSTLLIVEYDREKANPWVPYPISFRQLKQITIGNGFTSIKMIGSTPSKYDQQAGIYSAVLSIE